jgi:hypothetical protein
MKINLIIEDRSGKGRPPLPCPQPTSRTPVLLFLFISLSPTVVVRGMKIYMIIVEWVREG